MVSLTEMVGVEIEEQVESPENSEPNFSGRATTIITMPHSDSSVDTASYDSADDDDEYRLAQKEWQESVEELQQLALVLILPWLGKFLGRKTSHWRTSSSSSFRCRPHPTQCMLATSASASERRSCSATDRSHCLGFRGKC